MGWWDFAVRAFALLTTPRADVERCDREVETLARDSAVGRMLHAVDAAIRCAWTASRTRSAVETTIAAVARTSDATAWRVGGWMVTVVGATALALNPLATRDPGPLIWVVPALVVVVGLFVMACASVLARAAADRRRRSPSSTQ